MADKIQIEGQEIAVKVVNEQDYISLTDIAKANRSQQEPRFVIRSWLGNNNTVLFIEEWENLHNGDFNRAGFITVKEEAMKNAPNITPTFLIEKANCMSVVSKAGRYGGTYAHVDVAFEFASWIEPKFKVRLIMDYRRLKSDEYQRNKLEWNETRFLSKINAGILSASVKENQEHKYKNKAIPYASAFDMINLAVFGKTAKEWKMENPDAKGNIRDSASTIDLILISNLESLNSVYLNAGASYEARLIQLYEVAKKQREILAGDKRLNDEKKFLE